MDAQLALALPSSAPSNLVVINARCTLRIEEQQRVIVVGGLPVHHYDSDDAAAEAYAMVLLVDSGFAQQTEVARAFGKSERTVRRQQERYAQVGMVGLGGPAGWRRGRRRIARKRRRGIETLKSQGLSNRTIAQRFGVNEKAIRKLVGPSKDAAVEQLDLSAVPSAPVPAGVSEESADPLGPVTPAANAGAEDSAAREQPTEDSEPVPMSLDRDAGDRTFDRQLAYLGLLDDAAPIFRDGSRVPSSQAPDCACTSRCSRHRALGWPSPARRPSAAPLQPPPQLPEPAKTGHFFDALCQEV